MTSVQRFLPNARNLVREAVLSASSVRTSAALRTLSVSRQGNGRVRLVGDYTGHESATYDVEIASGGTTLRASTPVFSGVGNGTLEVTNIAAPAVTETWTLTLVDLGTDTTHAQLQIESITLRAAAAGAAGNLVRVIVTPDLTRTATDYSLLADWPAGSATLAGAEFDFGGLPLSAKNELDANSARFQFGTDHTVYRPYRTYTDGAWRYGLTPAPAKAIPAGTRAWSVTGGYDVTVTNGTTTETYADIESFYDLLAALASSALVEVVGVVTADRQPGGMAMRDIPLRTSSWVLAATGVELSGLAPAADAPTELVTITCSNDDTVGAETWTVAGTVSGELGSATTGAAFTSDALGFTVPAKAAGGAGATSYATRYEPVTRTEGEGVPSVCVHDVTLGANARPMSVTWTYTQRGLDAGLDCNNAVMYGRIDMALLGLEGGDMALDPALKSRLTEIYEWRSDVIDRTIYISSTLYTHSFRKRLVDAVASLAVARLNDVIDVEDGPEAWDTFWAAVTDELDVFDGAWTDSNIPPTNISTSPYTGGITVGFVFTTADGQYRCTAIKRISDGERDYSATATALVTTGWTSEDELFEVSDGVYSFTFGRVEGTPTVLKDGAFSVALDGSSSVDFRANTDESIRAITDKISAWADVMLIELGISPKSNASSRIGDGGWRDTGASAWWMDKSGKYFPVFSNVAYITASQSCGSGASAGIPEGQPYSTRELGFWIAVDGEQYLKEGDTITVTIASVDGARPYAVGDKAEIQIITAGPAYLAGGVDGDDTHTWTVTGSTSGAHPAYEVPSDGGAVPEYSDDGVSLQIEHGGIPFALGDRWVYDIEAGQFRWRKGVASWSSLTDIDAEVELSDGVSAQFLPGAAPSFVGDDAYQFSAEQPAAPSHLATPAAASWAWTGDTATLTAELPAGDITALAIARHTLPSGATVTIEIGDGTDWEYTVSLDPTRSVALAMIAADWSVTDLVLEQEDDGAILTDEEGYEIAFEGADATVLRLTIEDADGATIGWLWAGDPLATTYNADTCRLVRQWANTRGAGINPARQYLGRGTGGEIAWDAGGDQTMLTDADRIALLAMLDDLQTGAEPLILVPHHLHPEDAALVDIQFEQVEYRDVHEWQPDNSQGRWISMSIPLAAVLE